MANPQPIYDEFDRTMESLAQSFQQAIKDSLAKPYPFAPGYTKQRAPFGVRNMKVKTGALYNSIKVLWVGDPRSRNMKIQVDMLDYWKYVNDGRKPGKYVPIKPLIQWIRQKGFNRASTGRFKKFNVKGMAFAVSKNIQKFGIQPTYFYDDAVDGFIDRFDEEGVRALGIDIKNFFEKVVIEEFKKELK